MTTPMGFAAMTVFSCAKLVVSSSLAAVTAFVMAAHALNAPTRMPTAAPAAPRATARNPSQELFCCTQPPNAASAGIRLFWNQP